MNENVKIKIDEYDKTSPAGRGIDSTDIAFIPGFSVLSTAPQNQPTLITSTKEFDNIFGSTPRVLTSKDVENYIDLGFKAGDYDRSYVYAKELLFQGMPIVYSNIVNKDFYTVANLYKKSESTADIPVIKFYNNQDKEIENQTFFDVHIDTTKSTITLIANADVSTEDIASIAVTNTVNIDGATNNVPAITTFETTITAQKINELSAKTDLSVFNIHIDNHAYKVPEAPANAEDNILLIPISSLIKTLSKTQVEFINKDVNKESAIVDVFASFDATLKAGESIVLTFKKVTSSALDVFYKADADGNILINEQWDIPSTENPVINTIADKSIYSVKYITSGGYPSVISTKTTEDGKDKYSANPVFAYKMLAAAAHRGEAVALIDYQCNETEQLFSINPADNTFYSKIHSQFDNVAYAEYGAMMAPWGIYTCGATLSGIAPSTSIEMPASFGYLMCVAKAIKTSPNWLAMAGVTRGIVPGLQKLLVPGNAIANYVAEDMQPKFGVDNHRVSVNTITNIRPYGLTLWGNRTLKSVSNDGTVALNFLNTRNMLSDIKKLLYTTAKSCMFEQNSDDLWRKFKDGIRPLLDRLKAGNGLSDYKIVRGTTKYNGDPLTKGEIAAIIKIYPMYAVEYFELSVDINDEEVTVD